jgi:HD-like signal output (HDOD) protein
MADISVFLQSVKLPVMPEVAHALIRTLNDEQADVGTVRDVIAKDPTLTATLLRMANSALFGLSRTVNTLDNAVSVVGMSQIRARALSICMANVFVLPQGLNRLEFWRNSMACAGYAKWLAQTLQLDEQEAWLTGMMQRLGEITIAQHSPRHLEGIEKKPCPPGARWARERQLVGFDEGQITAEIARRWDFPDTVVDALRSCSAPMDTPELSRLGAVVHLAGWLADMPGVNTQTLAQLPATVVQALNLDLDKLAESIPDGDAISDTSSLAG